MGRRCGSNWLTDMLTGASFPTGMVTWATYLADINTRSNTRVIMTGTKRIMVGGSRRGVSTGIITGVIDYVRTRWSHARISHFTAVQPPFMTSTLKPQWHLAALFCNCVGSI